MVGHVVGHVMNNTNTIWAPIHVHQLTLHHYCDNMCLLAVLLLLF